MGMEEQTLILYGWPLPDALSLFHSMRRTGELPAFMEREHEKYVERMKERSKVKSFG